ncbi:hypothetical protein PIB30_010618 [Stylosanthes scabra]|uniref:Exocyst subunit Exo70 family protein n=1 Tax=Stylosanthes scabra TaxID=79078 RepID=A0ABU6U6C5_9FABA|nr:hypothetical protein [Stylosanthes scabra]
MASLLTEIQRCLRQARVWRYVGLASTTVGLSCYALSSSFNHLFGRWNFLKIFIYILSSVIICFMILFAKAWQFSAAFRFKAHLSFLALTITAVYSFFLDKNVNGKPDVYSLISCAAFAVMCLCLSRQSHFGFEVDLLYFFLGALIVQLMKIHLILGIFGVGFSYSLVILRPALDFENEHQRLDDQYYSVVQVDSDSQQQGAAQVDSDSQQVSTDIVLIKSQFTACIKALKSCDRELINMLFKYAKDYTKTLLESNYEDPVPVDSNMVIDALPLNLITDLQEAVKLMLNNGFQKECYDSYISCRREYLQAFVSKLMLKPLGNFVHVPSFHFKSVFRQWITTSNLHMWFLFPNERRLSEQIFLGFSTVAQTIFTEICREFIMDQLYFADCFTFESSHFNTFDYFPMSVKVFRALDDLIPKYESLFCEKPCDSIRNEAINTCKRLRKATKGIFIELEDWIRNDKAISDVPGGLYPICSKVIECLNGIFEAWMTLPLEDFFEEHPMVVYRKGRPSTFFIQLVRIIELLERHLEVKFKSCSDHALRYVTAMNNIRHIEQSAQKWNSETGSMYNNRIIRIIRILNAKVRQNLEDYLTVSWDEVIGFLKLGNKEPYSVEFMKENLKLFNMHFKEICKVQSTWFVLDVGLRKEIRESIDNILLPIYGVFIGKLYNVLGSHANEYIEYSMLDIDALLNDLFRG